MAELQKQLGGVEDLLIGQGTVVQNRGGTNYIITKLNGNEIPYSGEGGGAVSVNAKIDEALATAGAAEAGLITSLYKFKAPAVTAQIHDVVGQESNNFSYHGDMHLGQATNLQYASEDMSTAQYLTAALATKTPTDSITWKGITLSRVDFIGFNDSIYKQTFPEGSYRPDCTPVPGDHYLFSCYILALTADEAIIWNRDLGGGGTLGHNARLLTNRVRRIWWRGVATSATQFDFMADPTIALGSGVGSAIYWAQLGGIDSSAILYMGGFQREQVPAATEGVVVTGDSRSRGVSGGIDASNSAIWTRYAESILQIPFFARGVGGDTLVQMDTGWAANVTPLKVNCSHVIINGGTNDIINFVPDGTDPTMQTALALMQGAVNSMITKAGVDNLIPVVVAVGPNATTAAEIEGTTFGHEALRQAYNAWVKATFPLVLDFDSILADPYMPRSIIRDPDWYADGTHAEVEHKGIASKAVGIYVATWEHWNFTKPSAYQPWLDNTYINTFPDAKGVTDDGGMGFNTIDVTGLTGNVSYRADKRCYTRTLKFTGALAGNINIRLLADVPRFWIIDNQATGFTLTMQGISKTNVVLGVATATLTTGQHIVYSDGTQIYLIV